MRRFAVAAPPLRVLFASVAAGGGHHTVRDALVRATQAADPRGERIAVSSWTSQAGFDNFYRWCVQHGWQWLAYLPTRWFSFAAWVAAFSNPKLLRECVALLRRAPPDVVVSTHLILTAALQLARWWVGASTRVVGVVPDYGVPDRGFFPRVALFRPDVTWVNGEDTYAFAAPRAAPGEVELLGTLVAEDFTRVREQLARAGGRTVALKRQWQAAVAVDWPRVAGLDVTKPTVAFYGGSGFAGQARPVMEALLARDDVGARFNVVVLCGRDEALRASLDAVYGHRAGFAVLGFLPHAKLAALYGLTDVPVMGSIAHSSLQELLETATGPLLVFHVIVGTEPPYLDYLAKHRLGTYEPDAARMAALVLEAVGVTSGARWAPLAGGFTARAWALRDASRERAARVADCVLRAARRQELSAGQPVEKAA